MCSTAGSTLTAGAGDFKYVDGGTFTNNGTLAWNTSNLLYLQNGANFNNQGLFVANASTAIVDNGGVQPSFNNLADATLRAAAGTTLTVSDVLINAGTLDAAAGATIAHSGARFNNNTVFSGAGINSVNGSSAFNGFIQADNLLLTAGSFTGTNATLNGTVGWTGGSFTGSVALNAGSTLTAGSGGFKYIDGASFTNNGAMVWNTANALYLQNGASWVNKGLFTANASTTIVDNGGARPVLDNSSAGTLRAAGGSTLSLNNVLRNNGGRLDAEAGSSIGYTGAAFNTGTRFSGAGTHMVTGNNSFNGAITAINGNLVLASGTKPARPPFSAATSPGPAAVSRAGGSWPAGTGSLQTPGDSSTSAASARCSRTWARWS